MKIGIISDTHSHPLPQKVLDEFKGVEFIIHAGDFCSADDVKVLSKIKPVKGVFGNMDGSDIRKLFPEKQIIEWEGFRLGVYHGAGSRKQVLDFVKHKFSGEKLSAIIFGHSHEAMNQTLDGVLYFNPGSPNDHTAANRSFGILEIKKDKLIGTIIKLD